ncbi:sialate O-acetylesterase [Rufibacter latericius]|uniref:Sialate O-acetylesterase n=1 Tax=Rufibacter latericius TaxID=2487040 RepID=A0A3M9MAC2_9BACT|nr:sialate O-acetylesterase [Rufibacter latericius]RNI22494.1 sialate O-acetylesterase [Rufibacter latericius]
MKNSKAKTSWFYSSLFLRVAFTLTLLGTKTLGYGQVRLPKIFSDNMVLQREMDIPVWGTSKPAEQITVQFGENRVKTVAGPDGKWMLRLPQMPAGGPHLMKVYEGSQAQPVVTFQNVLIGDVWLASGQSNMEWQVQQSMNAAAEIKNANYPAIRLFNVPHDKKIQTQQDVIGGSWKAMDSAGVKTASAVAYFFARDLHLDLKVPIGIVQATWGGTPVEAWTSREQLLSTPITHNRILQNDSITEKHFIKDSLDLVRFWDIVYNPKNKRDKTIPSRRFNDSEWPGVMMPATLKDMNMPGYEGMVWLRKTIRVPQTMGGKELSINLGHPEMNYTLYFNGQEIAKNIWNANPRHQFRIPDKLVKQGENVISVRMAFLWGGGGFNPPAEEMYLTDGTTKIPLTGPWKYRQDLEPSIPKIQNYHRYPTYLYNAMINPIVPYGIKGFLWYQGEDNVAAPQDYRTLFPMLISDWRIRWQQGYLPFLYVQLANFMKQQPEPSESDWAALREAQAMTLSQPNTGMASIIDIGEADNIHPQNKQEVGRRLALVAKKMVYLQPVQASGPRFQTSEIAGDKIVNQFSEAGAGLATRGNHPLKGFTIAGSDRKFYWANATIEGNKVIVSSEKVKNPVAVRYAWADNPEANLINKERLPAIPFRTDQWEAASKK